MFKDMFTLGGRWNRLDRWRYLWYNLAALLLFVVLGVLLGLALSLAPEAWLPMGLRVMDWLGLLLAGWVAVCLGLKRVHDLDKPGGWVLLLLVPVLNLFFGLYLVLMPGRVGENNYGPDPQDE